MHGHPALLLADVEQYPVDPLLGARAGIEVVAEQLVDIIQAVVHHDLTPAEMRVPEGRGDVDDRLRLEIRGQLVLVNDPLQQRESEGEEPRVVRRNHQGFGALVGKARVEGEGGERLGLEPFEGGLAHRLERLAEAFTVSRLVGGAGIADDHAVGVATAHVGLGVVGADAVAGAADGGLDHPAAARHLVGDLMDAPGRVAHREGHELGGGTGHRHARCRGEQLCRGRGQGEIQQRTRGCGHGGYGSDRRLSQGSNQNGRDGGAASGVLEGVEGAAEDAAANRRRYSCRWARKILVDSVGRYLPPEHSRGGPADEQGCDGKTYDNTSDNRNDWCARRGGSCRSCR